MSNIIKDASIPKDITLLRTECDKSIRRIVEQIDNKRASTWSIARKTDISQSLVVLIYNNPQRNLSRKVMIKIIRATTRPKRRKSKNIQSLKGHWYSDAK
jgi:hypothetical protein